MSVAVAAVFAAAWLTALLAVIGGSAASRGFCLAASTFCLFTGLAHL